MRWEQRPPKIGQIKRWRFFALVPICTPIWTTIGDGRSSRPAGRQGRRWRWLEMVTVVRRYEARDLDNAHPFLWRTLGFEDELLLDKIEGQP